MKKLFTLVAMAFMAIGANAQAVVAEVDWTQKSEWDGGWYSSDYAEVSVEQGTGLIINCVVSIRLSSSSSLPLLVSCVSTSTAGMVLVLQWLLSSRLLKVQMT